MRRRTYLGLGLGALTPLAGCTLGATPSPAPAARGTPRERCPALLDADRTVCPGDESGPLAVTRSREAVLGGAWSLAASATNRADHPYATSPHAWSVFRQDGTGWSTVAPDAGMQPRLTLAPGEAYTWQLSASAGRTDGADQRVVLDPEPGTYAFAVPFRGPDRVAAVATFDVTG